MTKTMKEMMAKFTPEEQAEIQAEANDLIAEEMKRQLRQKQNQRNDAIKINQIDYQEFKIKNNCLIVLPDNFLRENMNNYLYSSETLSFYKYAKKNIEIAYLTEPELLLERRAAEWFAPGLLLTSEMISNNPEIISIICGLISNYIYDIFKSRRKSNIHLNVVYKETKTLKLTEINYEGSVEGLSKLEQALLEIVKAEVSS